MAEAGEALGVLRASWPPHYAVERRSDTRTIFFVPKKLELEVR